MRFYPFYGNMLQSRPGGEIGRRASLRCWWAQALAGSNPVPGNRHSCTFMYESVRPSKSWLFLSSGKLPFRPLRPCTAPSCAAFCAAFSDTGSDEVSGVGSGSTKRSMWASCRSICSRTVHLGFGGNRCACIDRPGIEAVKDRIEIRCLQGHREESSSAECRVVLRRTSTG